MVYLPTAEFNGTFYLHPTCNCGENGLPWAITYNETKATSESDGKSNTSRILLDQAGQTDDYAAKICDDLVAYGFDDWYLPSRGELNAMYVQLHVNDLGAFANAIYWSSTEATAAQTVDNAFDSWTQFFSNGKQKLGFKNVSFRCRCVRR